MKSRRQISGRLSLIQLEELKLMWFFAAVAQANRRLAGRDGIGAVEAMLPGGKRRYARLGRNGGD
jgi:hypothetical protein